MWFFSSPVDTSVDTSSLSTDFSFVLRMSFSSSARESERGLVRVSLAFAISTKSRGSVDELVTSGVNSK